MKMTEIKQAFDAFKPAIAADYTRWVTATYDRLLAAYGPTFRSGSTRLSNHYGRDGGSYRAIRSFIKHADDSRFDSPAVGINTDRLAKSATQYADEQVDGMTAKLNRKLGDLAEVTVPTLDTSRVEFVILGLLHSGTPGARIVRCEQSRVMNVSPKGNPFHQWPARIYVDGKFTSEKQFKTL